jgi:hypothetical protein
VRGFLFLCCGLTVESTDFIKHRFQQIELSPASFLISCNLFCGTQLSTMKGLNNKLRSPARRTP